MTDRDYVQELHEEIDQAIDALGAAIAHEPELAGHRDANYPAFIALFADLLRALRLKKHIVETPPAP